MSPEPDDSLCWPRLQRAVEAAALRLEPPPWRERLVRRMRSGSSRGGLPPGVYMVIYHSIVEPGESREWEREYRKGSVSAAAFARQLDLLGELMTPIPLSRVPALWEEGGVDRPCFVVTFDDGYENNLRVAAPLVRARGIRPALFVNAAYARGQEVFYRVLAARLVARGEAERLAAALREAIPGVAWSGEPRPLFDQTKSAYRVEVMERVVDRVYRECLGDPADLGVHLKADEVARLQREGWEIGNHTVAHRVLAWLTEPEVAESVEHNALWWREQGVALMPFLGYPFGCLRDVGGATGAYLAANPGLHGLFAGGGVNLRPSRSEWLRFGLSREMTRATLLERLWQEVDKSRRAYHQVYGV